jgi:hypothetical protein
LEFQNEWEEEAAEVAEIGEVRGMLLTVFLLNVSVVQILGGVVVDSLHKGFQEVVFILRNTSRTVEFGEDVIYGFKE